MVATKSPSTPRSVSEFIGHIEQFGDATAIIVYTNKSEYFSIKYNDLCRRIRSLAYILKSNIKKGDRIILNNLNSYDWITSYFAIIAVGGVAVTVDNRASQAFVSQVYELTKPTFVFTTKVDQNLVKPQSAKVIEISKLDLTKCTDCEFPEADTSLAAEIVFTSGTWSQPKGVTLSQNNIYSNLEENLKRFELSPSDRFLSIIPLAHMYEQMAGLLTPLFYGSRIYYMPLDTKEDFEDALKTAQPTKLILVPLVCELLYASYKSKLSILFPLVETMLVSSRILPRSLRAILWTPLRLPLGSRLNQMVVGGAPLQIEVDRFFQGLGVTVGVGYGLSETSPVIASSMNQRRKAGEVGKPYSGFKISQNERGELLVRGPSVFMGYWPDINNTEETWFNTGDIVIMDQKGSLVIQGRSKNMFVYPSGDKIFAEDIEFLVNKFWNCESCCINMGIGLSNELKLVVTHPNPDKEELMRHLRDELPGFVTIDDVIYYGDSHLPSTFSKKLNRKAIRDWLNTVYLR